MMNSDHKEAAKRTAVLVGKFLMWLTIGFAVSGVFVLLTHLIGMWLLPPILIAWGLWVVYSEFLREVRKERGNGE